jgi:hypothetical protein
VTVLVGVSAGLGVFLGSHSAQAFCQTNTCDTLQPGGCPVDQDGCPTEASGLHLRWPDACVTFGVQKLGSPKHQITFAQAEDAAIKAFQSWISVPCGENLPSIGVVAVGEIECDKVEYNYPEPGEDFPPGPNANVIMFRDQGWPYLDDPDDERETLALTTITFLSDTGDIVDADIEVNSANVALSVGDTNITNDLQAILTHEAGHFFGLSHSKDPEATMNKMYNVNAGDSTFRSLARDDRDGICAIYPPGAAEVGDCRGEGPRFGLSRYCHTPVEASAGLLCSMVRHTPKSPATSWLGLSMVSGVGLVFAGRRKGLFRRRSFRSGRV